MINPRIILSLIGASGSHPTHQSILGRGHRGKEGGGGGGDVCTLAPRKTCDTFSGLAVSLNAYTDVDASSCKLPLNIAL